MPVHKTLNVVEHYVVWTEAIIWLWQALTVAWYLSYAINTD